MTRRIPTQKALDEAEAELRTFIAYVGSGFAFTPLLRDDGTDVSCKAYQIRLVLDDRMRARADRNRLRFAIEQLVERHALNLDGREMEDLADVLRITDPNGPETVAAP
jgi:hypothetical protein